MSDPAFLLDGPSDAATTALLAHGAGAPMDSPWMNAVAAALATQGLAVARFEFGYMAARRNGERRPPPRGETLIPEFVAAAQALAAPARLVIGGKSLGGRVASMAAHALAPAGVVCLGYPFHPPGKTPTLIIQGTRDPFGGRDEVEEYALSPAIDVCWIEDGDHDLAPRKRIAGVSAAEARERIAERVAAWAAALP
jgi:predicted alpha/beta-hydrolase family hydrolase